MSAKPAVAPETRYPLIAVFDDAPSAERAYLACSERGYEIGEVNVVMAEGTRQKLERSGEEIQAELATRKAEGGELGGPKGGRTGIVMTIAAAAGAAIVMPAIGIVAGPVAVALTAAGAAGAAGGLIALFGDWGVPEARVHAYQADIRKGAILLSVQARTAGDANALANAWRAAGGRDVHIA